MAGGSLAKVNVEGSSPFARSHFEGNPERVPKPSRALAPSGEAILRQRERAMALANLGWGYMKIRDALRTGLKIEIGRTTVANILLEEGIEPAPEREKKRTWKQFMKSHWDTLYACDFFQRGSLGAIRHGSVHGVLRHRAQESRRRDR